MDELKRISERSKAKHMLFLVDACYGGLAAQNTRSLQNTDIPNFIEKISNGIKIEYNETLHKSMFDGQPIISTIPMPAMMDLVGWKDKPEFIQELM